MKPLQFDTNQFANLIAQNQQRRIALENHSLQMREGQQKIEAGDRAAKAATLKAKDDEISRTEFVKAGGDLDKWEQGLLQNGASAEAVMAAQTHKAALKEKIAKIASDQLPVKRYQNEQLLGLNSQAIQQLQADPQGFAANWPKYAARANQISPEESDHLDPNHVPTMADLQLYDAGHKTLAQGIDQSKEQRDQAEELRRVAEEKQKELTRPDQALKIAAEAQTAEDTAAGRKPIQPEEQARLDLQQRAQEQTLVHNQATEANATALLKVAQGHLGVSQQQASIARAVYDQTYGEGANPALVGVEPKLRVQASSAAQKAANEFVTASEAAENMKTMIDLAKSGNKVAYAYAPTTGVLTINTAAGVKRVNMAEISSYAGAGSAADKVTGWLGKQASGASIPADILKDMESLHGAIAGNAASAYNTKLAAVNQNYRSNFQPVKGAESSGKVTVTDPHGGVHTFDSQANADAFKKSAGIQ